MAKLLREKTHFRAWLRGRIRGRIRVGYIVTKWSPWGWKLSVTDQKIAVGLGLDLHCCVVGSEESCMSWQYVIRAMFRDNVRLEIRLG